MIYLDNAATTQVRREVIEAMLPFLDKKYGNASSLHSMGQEAKVALERSRESIAKVLKAEPNEIIFCSCATEANNLALKGLAFEAKKQGKNHLIVSRIEHHCVLHAAQWLEENGFEVTYLPVDEYGFVDLGELERAINEKTFLVSIMYANNEIGTIEPIREVVKICQENSVPLHSDAVQAFGKIPLYTKGIDMLSLSAHKIYGPKGVGLLMKRKELRIQPLLHGGGHEFDLRSGTENVAGIVGFAKAMELALKEMPRESKRQAKMRDKLIKNALQIPESRLNGHPKKRLPNNANFSFRYVEGESIVMKLNELGIAASTGSACSSPKLEPSHVLLALGLAPSEAHGSLRLTLGRFNKMKDINYTIKVLPKVIAELRAISPFWNR
ncbi:MAG: cysteine desulfurase NifS [Candidatus Iainarchaeum archaeon]|uniref:cysteine desulfurase n=1 Tax=Candidatus Iainarchaeum sp. TaxID=3101447 RepID=A0A497JH19_9ARCH|nr:MAG: cysteine desulfurase NifS [Candidatus Diapherotrites archaeon]